MNYYGSNEELTEKLAELVTLCGERYGDDIITGVVAALTTGHVKVLLASAAVQPEVLWTEADDACIGLMIDDL